MANKKSSKKAQQGIKKDSSAAPSKAADKKAAKTSVKAGKAAKAAKSKKSAKKAKGKGAKVSFFQGIKNKIGAVRTEMHRVTWPTKKELANYSVAVVVSLIVVGVIIAILDLGIGEGLALFSGLRG